MDIHGNLLCPISFSNFAISSDPYCGSCIARAIRSYFFKSTSFGPRADKIPSQSFELNSTTVFLSRIGNLITAPS